MFIDSLHNDLVQLTHQSDVQKLNHENPENSTHLKLIGTSCWFACLEHFSETNGRVDVFAFSRYYSKGHHQTTESSAALMYKVCSLFTLAMR
jgi:hypothetical protein